MTKKHVRIASVVMPVMIAMLLLFAGSSRVTASDQPSTANVAVKNRQFRSWTAGDHDARRNNSHLDKR